MSFSTHATLKNENATLKKKLLKDLTKKTAALWLTVSSAENNIVAQ